MSKKQGGKAHAASCPNCSREVEDDKDTGCVLAALVQVIRDREELTEEQVLAIHASCDADALWEALAPVIDQLQAGGFAWNTPHGEASVSDQPTPSIDPLPASQLPMELEWTMGDDGPELGVSAHGYFVVKPHLDVGLMNKVDPMECWGISPTLAKLIDDLNSALPEALEDAINAGCLRLQQAAGIRDGGYAGIYFSDAAKRVPVSEVLAEYIVRDVNTTRE
ncbi:hypothetical protein [Acidovorax sp. sic0104]|uniref:hypothetical protein n=1 Tax=Acidovorax sp. sic0104 TaxID=2854784 RepID=UPI001C45FCD8|nr:hypothetical protein [Acidovorax sp. sic0104]MBV7542180.1 hypothetical protein [Acidovorax sp. sic0104]